MKKVFVISSILLVIVLIFLGIYNFAFRKDAPKSAQVAVMPEESAVKEKILEKKSEKVTVISSGSVLGVVIDKKTEEIKYYDSTSGLVWKTDAFGRNKQQVSEKKVSGLKSVSWAPDHSKVLTTIGKDGQDLFYEYDYQLQKSTALKNGLDTVVWDNLGTKIFYKYYDSATKKRTLNVANPDGSGWQQIAETEIRNISIAPVPLTSLVSFWNSPSANEETRLQTVSVTGGESEIILSGKYGADYLWAPNGSMAIVSSLLDKDSKKITLGSVTVDGKYQDLNIPTIASKCVWSQDSKMVYYALPGGIPSDVIMPDDYQNNKFTTSDTFWKMNMATGEKNRIIDIGDISRDFDSDDLFLSPTEDALYFVNKIDQKLYRLEL